MTSYPYSIPIDDKNRLKKECSLDYQIQCSSCMLLTSTFILKVKPITFHPGFYFNITNIKFYLGLIIINKTSLHLTQIPSLLY